MSVIYPLSSLPAGRQAKIVWLSDQKPIAGRLLGLGFEPGAPVSCILRKKNGRLAAFLIRGAVIALRRDDADLVFVEETPGPDPAGETP